MEGVRSVGGAMTTEAESKVWLITGASSGFGLAVARRVLAAGHCAALTARDPGVLAGLCAEYPDQARAFAMELRDGESVAAAVAGAEEAFGKIDVLLNNAGRGLHGALEEVSEAQMEECIAVNLTGALRVIRAVLPGFRARGGGRILQVGAAAAVSNYPGFSVYGGAKAGVELACEALAAEVGPLGIRVTVVIPGPFRTDFIRRSLDRAEEPMEAYARTAGKFGALLKGMDGKQPGDPDKAAAAMVRISEEERPPFRLVLGTYATGKVKKHLEAVRGELEAWEAVGKPTEFS